jgi:hypothetical protein
MVEWMVLVAGGRRENVMLSSPKMVRNGRRERMAWLKAIYSSSMVERAVSVWRRLPQTTGV